MAILFGPVPPGGTGTLPGLVLCALALIDFLTLPGLIAKFRSGEVERRKIIVPAVACVVLAALGLMLYFGKI